MIRTKSSVVIALLCLKWCLIIHFPNRVVPNLCRIIVQYLIESFSTVRKTDMVVPFYDCFVKTLQNVQSHTVVC